MLLIALAILAVAWILVAIVVVGLCVSAAAGDRQLARAAARGPSQRQAVERLRVA